MSEHLTFVYTNWRGETAVRHVKPDSVRFGFGSTEWHPKPQWLMSAMDVDKGRFRDFAVKDIVFSGGKVCAVIEAMLKVRADYTRAAEREDVETASQFRAFVRRLDQAFAAGAILSPEAPASSKGEGE